MTGNTKSGRGWRAGLVLACLIAWGMAMRESSSRLPGIADDKTRTGDPSAVLSGFEPVMSRISVGSPAPSVHSATAVELPDGTIRAYWFGGSREGASDVAIWSAAFRSGTWSTPEMVVDELETVS